MLMESDETGSMLGDEKTGTRAHFFNHIEYDNRSLADEYERDVLAGKGTAAPNCSPNGDTRPRRKTAGAAMRTCCSRTGSTRFIRRRPSRWKRSGRHRRWLARTRRRPASGRCCC